MPEPAITCLACGVFRTELDALVREGRLDCTIETLESMLHMNPVGLERAIERAMDARPGGRVVLLYGDCHAWMRETETRDDVSRVAGLNCCEILLGHDAYHRLQRAQAFIFLPEWARRWRDVFTRELGFTDPVLAQAFMKEHRRRLVYLDTGVVPVPVQTLDDIAGFFGMPVEVQPVSLDVLLQGIRAALRTFARPPHDDPA
jgi:hypothetical protein